MKIRNILFVTLLTLGWAMSCSEDETSVQPNPSISFIQDSGYVWQDTTLLVGESIKIGIKAKTGSSEPLTHFNYLVIDELDTISIDSGIYVEDFEFSKIITKSFAETENWIFTVHDKDGRPASIPFTLFKADSSAWGDIVSMDSVVLGAQNNPTLNSFVSWQTQSVYSLEEAHQNQAIINLLYYYDLIEEDENTIASPGANIDPSFYSADIGPHTWDPRNTSRFILTSLSEQEFWSCDNDSLILANGFEFNSGKRKAKNLNTGDIYAFNDNSKKGLFLVHEVDGTDQGFIRFSLKVQIED